MSRTEADAVIDSDNRSARLLTRSLGTPEDAADALLDVLREGGDHRTTPAPAHGDDYPLLGETRWTLADSALWTSNLPCLTGSDHILELMHGVGPLQEWGIRRLDAGDAPAAAYTAAKGGWGTDADLGYVVRQIGLITMPGGRSLAVSMSTHAPRMTFEAGTRTLDTVARWVGRHLTHLPSGTCPEPADN